MVKKILILIVSSIISVSLLSCKGITINFDDGDTTSGSTDTSSDSTESNTSSSDSKESKESKESSDSKDSTSTSNSSNSTSNNDSNSNSNEDTNSTSSKNNDSEKTEVTVNITEDNNYYSKNPVIPQTIYYSNSFIFPNSSNSYLSAHQVAELNNYQLGIARNEIYARHGYIFDLPQFRNYFNSQNWYTPISKNVSLNKIEESNVALIKAEEDRRGVRW